MTDLLGGQEVWNEHAQALSSMLRAHGLSDDDVRQIFSTDAVRTEMVELVIAARSGVKSAKTPEIAALISKGWTLVEDVPSRLSQVRKPEFISFLQNGEEYVDGETMRARATKLEGNLGLADAAFLAENQQMIPDEFCGNVFLAFPGTVVRDSGDHLHVPCLHWDDESWILDFFWLGGRWDGGDRLVSCK